MWDEYGRHGYGWDWGDWLAMGLIMLLFWILLLTAVFLLLRWFREQRSGGGGGARHQDNDAADRMLAERFARGEIDEEEYRRRRSVLHGG